VRKGFFSPSTSAEALPLKHRLDAGSSARLCIYRAWKFGANKFAYAELWFAFLIAKPLRLSQIQA
jgi:hypothetical protein